MNRGEIFWGALLVVLGGLFFLKTAGLLVGDVFGWFWPLCVVAAGAWVLLGGFQAHRDSAPAHGIAIALQGARGARLVINHGVGRLEIGPGSEGGDFLTGNAGVAMSHSVRRVDDRLDVTIDAGPSFLPFVGPEGGSWSFHINPSVPTELTLRAGATQLDLDLATLQVTRLDYEGGASSLNLAFPESVERFAAHLTTGASSLNLKIPEGVAARIKITSPGSPLLDPTRFKSLGSGLYESTSFETASRRAEVTIDGGAISIHVE